MSRCFPFPPPGYEKKIRPDEADSLIKEKEKKEKKHKKEKKDKDKKEGKEKKDKETSKDKHKARKEKKEKHADRKDKDRDKEKSRSSEDKKGAGVLPNTVDREKPCKNNGNGESKFVQDLARRIRDEEEATHSQSVGKISFPCGGVTENNISCPIPQTNDRKDDEKRINNTNRNFPAAKRSENDVRQLSSCTEQRGVEVMVKPVEKKDQAKIKELQEKNHHTYSVTKSDKPLYNEGIKKGEPKYITDRSSKEMKEEKTEVINKNGQEKPKFEEGGPRLKEREHDTVDIRNLRVPELSRGSVKNLTTEGIIGKRKDLETNGLSYENGSRPNKIQRPVVKNGRELGACQTPSEPVSVLLCNPEAKEHRNNGFIDSQEHKSHSPVSSVNVKENCEAPAKKRPHSDLKYLDKILNVPKREELHEVDDNEEQEWLFGQSGVQLLNKQQRRDSTVSLDETLQVWNQALRIESADIVALPYVVPF